MSTPAFWPGRFAGKVAVVTGAAQGIGRDVALRLVAEGARVVMADRSPIVEEAREEAGENAMTVLADLEEYAGAASVMDAAMAAHGRIDVLVNNVGGTIWSMPYEHYTPEQISAEIRRSLFPTLWGCHAVLGHMLVGGGGAIVNVSSIATRGLMRVPYGAAKGGVNAMTVNLAWEYAQQGIRVNAVATGGTEAPPRRIPRGGEDRTEQEKIWYQQLIDQTVQSSFMHRYGTISEQVNAILFLASDEASYITGVTLPVGGGDRG
ncbi:1,6-dihydroxycyclohexa-2,4-diene-1-carboxylate dehydrogenase [Acidocella sp. KAb 2-4]|uniref:1,6-dihydroxycyclohexa-2,4-diene-1-carboxylate dehydrogenase n=1 Tax=Acidocella sp. KAb 2-4 TaxID=2885158 RepID=UPI001D06B0A8|nr:1,6-dihydroxycyclohexa-2,4-diene-1-carboxylate dehydrogenase [Acidocella sp. KAb 2-4]MCB5943844.1 1,6-dihydroxycyclohexa-2,4-diene-1-carboxylate dehydrogenase [Acidocella sp. KAb 2-4]